MKGMRSLVFVPSLALGLAFGASACRSPSVSPAGGDAGDSIVTPGKLDAGPGGTDVDGGHIESPGVAPTCTTVDPAKEVVSDMVDVPAGEFLMGCNPDTDAECRADEKPGHQVTLAAFQIDRTEVSQAQYFACVKAGQCTFPKCTWNPCDQPDIPVSCVHIDQALAYCGFVGRTVPTEAQWEKAARGTDGRKFPWGNDAISCQLANIAGCGDVATPVGSKTAGASPYGALDMAGNVVEWTKDFYDPGYYATSPAADPTGPAQGGSYSGRGGGFKSEEIWHRTSARDFYEPTYTRETMGFRCVK